MTTNQQLELGFNGTQTRILGRRNAQRMARGQWWFARMREAVANAMDWQAQTVPPAEQILFSGVNRQVKI
jgi:hypothetical protein